MLVHYTTKVVDLVTAHQMKYGSKRRQLAQDMASSYVKHTSSRTYGVYSPGLMTAGVAD